MSQANRFVRVPFGLRNGLMWPAKSVENGLACGCRCPGCDAPLVSRNLGTRRRAHFAHHNHPDCPGGFESAIHRMAKQLICERASLLLPAWTDAESMPNPPTMADDAGRLHRGVEVELPARTASFSEVASEVAMGDYRPDVIAADDEGELLIEIRVSNAVDDDKTRRVQSEGRRMLEIDLSKITLEEAEDPERFESLVLATVSNRTWLSFPQATEAWRRSLTDLREHVRLCNRKIAEDRRRMALRAQQIASEQSATEARKEERRRWLRSPHESDLLRLDELTSASAIAAKLAALKARDEDRARRALLQVVPEFVRLHLLTFSEHAWAYEAHPALWQAEAYLRFVQGKAQ
jgi:hypothetical protein